MWLAPLAALVFLSSCRKDVSKVNNPDSEVELSKAQQLQNELPETAAPVFTAVTQEATSNTTGYYVGLPARYDSTTKNYPLLVFLHGMGQLSNANNKLSSLAEVGVNKFLGNKSFPASFSVNGKSYSFIVASPQFQEWPKASDVSNLIDYMVEKYRVDASRIYVVGVSIGGGTAWDVAADYGSKIAAIVPISGANRATEKKSESIAKSNVAVWAFHNSGDKMVSADITKDFVEKVNASNARPAAKSTIFDVNDHDAWSKATDPNFKENGLNIYEWMLQYSKSSK